MSHRSKIVTFQIAGWTVTVIGCICGGRLFNIYGWKALLLSLAFDFCWDFGKRLRKAAQDAE